MKKILFVLLLGFFLVGLVGAISSLGTVKQNTCFELYQTCDDCTYVNLTNIKYPNGTTENYNDLMTKTNQNFNYTFCKTIVIGDYTYTVAGDKGGVYSTEIISFSVTPSGTTNNLGIYLILIGIVYLIGFFGFFGKNLWVSMLGGLGMLALGLYFIAQGIVIYRDWLTNAISYITIGLGAIFTLTPIIEFIREEL